MKKCIITALLSLMVCALYAQSSHLILNEQEPVSGYRCLGTSRISVRNGFTDRHPIAVSVLAVESASGWSYSLEIAVSELSPGAIPEKGILLIRTNSGEVIELNNILPEGRSTDWVGEWIEGTANKIYYNKGSYPISRQQLDEISKGVAKIRMQISGGHFDTEYKKDKMGAAVAEHISVLDGANTTDIREGF